MAEVVLLINAAPPESLNKQERMHWGERRRVRQRWKDEAAVAWLNAGRPRFHRPEVQFRLYYRDARRRDPDNALASCKPILDGLKGRAFEDDHSGVVTLLPPVIGVDRGWPRVEILIREQGEGVA